MNLQGGSKFVIRHAGHVASFPELMWFSCLLCFLYFLQKILIFILFLVWACYILCLCVSFLEVSLRPSIFWYPAFSTIGFSTQIHWAAIQQQMTLATRQGYQNCRVEYNLHSFSWLRHFFLHASHPTSGRKTYVISLVLF